jgi:flavin-dependent dehydrogenase
MSVYDVAIIGGGPGGSTVGSLLKTYEPSLKVVILERERFPRDHVGESQLPGIGPILHEMGVWDQVEAANFPIKVGATYRWGRTQDLWDFEFLPDGKLRPEPRPAKYEGQRRQTAFQVDRAVYDQILLDRAAELGCEVRQETSVKSIRRTGDRVEGLVLADGSEIQAKHYVDASGHSGILRRAMGVEVECPTTLQNIAIWDYWHNAEWATTLGVGGTRVQVMSLGYGWLWFIPVGPDRTSIGLITPASYYKEQGKSPENLYLEAVASDPVIAPLVRNARREEGLSTTKDWSFVANRLCGENWFLVGESAGFADPILAAGLTLTHSGAKDVAYIILAMERGEHEREWLMEYYDTDHRNEIRNHMKFADYWYSANGVFTDLQDFASEIAKENGLDLNPKEAWQWLGQGGFIGHGGGAKVGGYDIIFAKQLLGNFAGEAPHFEMVGKTHFQTNLEGAETLWVATFDKGKITRKQAYRRNGKSLPMIDVMGWLVTSLMQERSVADLRKLVNDVARQQRMSTPWGIRFLNEVFTSLEVLVSEGWVLAREVQGAEPMPTPRPDFSQTLHANRDAREDARTPTG